VHPVTLHHYLTFHAVVPAPYTILAGVRKLPAATVRTIEPDGAERDRGYWRPTFSRDPARADWSAQQWQGAILQALRQAVKRRIVADVPIGVLLSGGIDSSVIVALLAQGGQRGLKTFSVGFEAAGGMSGDEFHYSDPVARAFDTDHHQLRIDNQALVPAVGDAIAAMSEPMVSHDAVAFYLLSQQVAKHVKVVQSGQGAEEVFAGYEWYPRWPSRGPPAGAGARRADQRGGKRAGAVPAPVRHQPVRPAQRPLEPGRQHPVAAGAAGDVAPGTTRWRGPSRLSLLAPRAQGTTRPGTRAHAWAGGRLASRRRLHSPEQRERQTVECVVGGLPDHGVHHLVLRMILNPRGDHIAQHRAIVCLRGREHLDPIERTDWHLG